MVNIVIRDKDIVLSSPGTKFEIIVPAHNEEIFLPRLLTSLKKQSYPTDLFDILVIADNCTDRTIEVASSFNPVIYERHDNQRIGKGFAIEYALHTIDISRYDAIVIVDADSVVHLDALKYLDQKIKEGKNIIQCYNGVANPEDSWFTRLMDVSRTIGNEIYEPAKEKMGFSSHLMGNGMCFHRDVILTYGWDSFSVGEDWEYYAKLIERRIRITFAKGAKVFHQESTSLEQATSQRLRWSSGRFAVFKNSGLKLFFKGLQNKDWFTLDASLPLVFPNYSLQINLTLMALVCSLILPSAILKTSIIYANAGLLILLLALFGAGVYLSGGYLQVFKALLRVPLFLLWKSIIDILSFTGIYKTKLWIRTRRQSTNKDSDR